MNATEQFDPVGQSTANSTSPRSTGQQAADNRQTGPDSRRDNRIRTVGKYRIERELGHGNCGVVYLAHDPFVDRQVALKLANPDPTGSGTDSNADDFLVEARSAGRLQHPNIVALYDAGVHDGRHYIVMEYVAGRTLGQIDDDELSPSRIVEIAYDCARALGYAHRSNVLHRDIKPDNVALREDGVAKIMDFSIAAVMQNQKVRPGAVLGTPNYMPPEQIAGATIGPATDLYSLGAVMYRMLTGHPPHRGRDQNELLMRIQCERCTPLHDLRPDLPPRLCAIVDRLLDLDPGQRFESGDALAAELLKVWDRRNVPARTRRLSESARLLGDLEFGAQMAATEIDELMAAGHLRGIDPGERIVSAGDLDDSLYVLISGNVHLNAPERTALPPGQVFGTLALPGVNAVRCDAVADGAALILEVPREALERCSAACRLQVFQACTAALLKQLGPHA